MTEIEHNEDIQVVISVDVGKNAHYAVALNRSCGRLLDCGLPSEG